MITLDQAVDLLSYLDGRYGAVRIFASHIHELATLAAGCRVPWSRASAQVDPARGVVTIGRAGGAWSDIPPPAAATAIEVGAALTQAPHGATPVLAFAGDHASGDASRHCCLEWSAADGWRACDPEWEPYVKAVLAP